jgi:predicted O-methyltransferase YrrM
MPLARTFDGTGVVSTLYDGYLDRLSRRSDIREYLPFLYETARSYPGVRVLELGTRQGNSTLAFLAAAEAAGGHVWSCDIADVTRDPQGMLPWKGTPRWTFIRGDDMHPAVRAALPGGYDVLFIDTSHEYGHTLAELRACMPRLVPGGVALLHDTDLTGWPGYDWTGTVPPVRQALGEYCAEAGLSWENMPGKYGLGVVRP